MTICESVPWCHHRALPATGLCPSVHLDSIHACVGLPDLAREGEGMYMGCQFNLISDNPFFLRVSVPSRWHGTHIRWILIDSLNFMFNWEFCVSSCNSILMALRPGILQLADCGRRTMTSSLALPRNFMLSYCSAPFRTHPLGVPCSLFLEFSFSSIEQRGPL